MLASARIWAPHMHAQRAGVVNAWQKSFCGRRATLHLWVFTWYPSDPPERVRRSTLWPRARETMQLEWILSLEASRFPMRFILSDSREKKRTRNLIFTILYSTRLQVQDIIPLTCIDYTYLHMARKVRTVRPAGEKQPTHFTLLVEKISICTTRVSKESPRSHICHPRLRLGRQLYVIWTFFTFRCIIYYSLIPILYDICDQI